MNMLYQGLAAGKASGRVPQKRSPQNGTPWDLVQCTWVVLQIMGPLWANIILRHFIFRGTKWDPNLGNYPHEWCLDGHMGIARHGRS